MGDDYRRKIECEMDRFEAEISSLARPPTMTMPPHQPPTTAFIPAQLRRHPAPAASGSASSIIAAAPVITRPPQVTTISGAPQAYRPPTIRPRVPIPQAATRGVRPMLRPHSSSAVVASAPPTTFSARPTIANPPVITGLPVPSQPGFIPVPPLPTGSSPVGMPLATPIVGAPAPPTPAAPTPVASIPLPNEPSPSDTKPSTSTGGDTGESDKSKKKKKKEKKQKKLVRCAGGTVWEDPSLQDWDPSDFRLFCGDLGNDVTDEVLTRVFSRYPSFQKARVIRDKRTNKTKGYGFVSFKDPNDFVRAVKELDGRYVGSRPIKLRKSNWKNRNVDIVRKREQERMQLLGINKKPKLF